MKKYFIMSDIHGFFNEMQKSLNEKGFDINNPDHIFVHLGDLLDRGSQTLETLKWVNSLPDDRKILIKGNHEDLLEDVFERGQFLLHDMHNGTIGTVINLAKAKMSEEEVFYYYGREISSNIIFKASRNKMLKKYLKSLRDWAEIGNYILVHGWIPCIKIIGETADIYKTIENWKEGDWIKARWVNGADAWSQGINIENKTIICGHYHTSWAHSHLHGVGSEFGKDAHFEPFVDKGIACIDACTAATGICNCYVIEEE